MLREVVAGARKAGLRVPKIRLEVVDDLPRLHGYARGGTVVVGRASLDYPLLCHEVAHVIVEQMIVTKAADHNRFWALVYGVLYQQAVDR